MFTSYCLLFFFFLFFLKMVTLAVFHTPILQSGCFDHVDIFVVFSMLLFLLKDPVSSFFMPTKFPCSVCSKSVNEGNSIFCDSCDLWTHFKCSGLSLTEFHFLSNSTKNWYCPKCLLGSLPFKPELYSSSSSALNSLILLVISA